MNLRQQSVIVSTDELVPRFAEELHGYKQKGRALN